jgi:hypothetical protein
LEKIHERFVGFAALLLDWDFAGDRGEAPAFSVVTDVLRGSVAARLDADLPEQPLVTKIDESDQRFGATQPRKVEHDRVSHAGDIQVRRIDAQAADFPHIRLSRIGALGGKLREYRKGQVLVITANGAESADQLAVGIDGAIGRGGAVELIDFKISEYG